MLQLKRRGRSLRSADDHINVVINGANFKWTLTDGYFLFPVLLPPVCTETNVFNVFASLMRVRQTHRGHWRVKGSDDGSSGTEAEMLSAAAAESVSMEIQS